MSDTGQRTALLSVGELAQCRPDDADPRAELSEPANSHITHRTGDEFDNSGGSMATGTTNLTQMKPSSSG